VNIKDILRLSITKNYMKIFVRTNYECTYVVVFGRLLSRRNSFKRIWKCIDNTALGVIVSK